MGEWQAAVPFAAVQMGCYALFDGWRWEKGGPWQLDQLEKNLKMHLYTRYIIYNIYISWYSQQKPSSSSGILHLWLEAILKKNSLCNIGKPW